MSYVAATATNSISCCCHGEWSNAIAEPIRIEASAAVVQSQQVQAYYDRRADVLSIAVRDGEPKYVVVGRGTFVIFADDEGVWSIDLEAEAWDTDVDALFPSMRVEM